MKDKWRGNEICEKFGEWRYSDNNMFVASDPNRACGFCKRENNDKGHDWCIRNLVGVENACCGHGEPEKAYAVLSNGKRVTGQTVFEIKAIQERYSPLGLWTVNHGRFVVMLVYPVLGLIIAALEAVMAFADTWIMWRGDYRGALANAERLKQIKSRKGE